MDDEWRAWFPRRHRSSTGSSPCYLDASALVKRYVTEPGSREVIQLTTEAAGAATVLVSRAEVAAAFSRAVRLGVLDGPSAGAHSAGSRASGQIS